jgi:hypothetical protein
MDEEVLRCLFEMDEEVSARLRCPSAVPVTRCPSSASPETARRDAEHPARMISRMCDKMRV